MNYDLVSFGATPTDFFFGSVANELVARTNWKIWVQQVKGRQGTLLRFPKAMSSHPLVTCRE